MTCSASASGSQPLATDHADGIEKVCAVNSEAVLTAILEAGRVMGDGSRIISMSTGLATRIGAPGLADYAASKAAGDAFSRGAARDLGRKAPRST